MKHTVLIVEDNPLTRKVVRLTLGSEGIDVLEARDAAEALAILEHSTPDLILQDLLLPDMDGFDLVVRLRSHPHTLGVPIIAFSGFLSRLEHGRAAAAGFNGFLPKPVEPSRLVQLVQAYLLNDSNSSQQVELGGRVLVVDDDAVQLKLAVLLLRELGLCTITASDGAQALEILRRDSIGAVLSDVLMPGIDGFSLCAAVKGDPELSHIPIVLVSSHYVEEADRQLAARMGANAFVVRTPDLQAATQALLLALGAADQSGPESESAPAAEHQARVQRQLERQAALNSSYAHRSSMHAVMLSVLAGVSEALIKSQNLENALPDVLASLLEASGVSRGAIYLRNEDDGVLVLAADSGYGSQAQEYLRRFCDQPELFERAVRELAPLLLSPQAYCNQESLLHFADAEYALLIPLVADQECLGLLFLASKGRDLSQSDWLPFARTMSVQIGQSLALSRAFAKLKLSETRYRGVVEIAAEGIFTLDSKRIITDVNPALERMLQRSSEELVGASILAFIDPSDRARAEVAYRELTSNGLLRVTDRRFRRADGQVVILDISATIKEIDGVSVAVGIARDVTEHVRVQAELRLIHTLTLGALEAADLGSTLQVVLRTICQATGWCYGAAWRPRSEALECIGWWTLDADAREGFVPMTQPCIAAGQGILGQVWSSREPLWLSSLSSLCDARRGPAKRLGIRGGLAVPVVAQNEVVAVLEFFCLSADRDQHLMGLVTAAAHQFAAVIARQRAQDAQKASELRFLRLTEAGIVGISVAELPGKLLEANDAYLSMLGCTRAELESGRINCYEFTPVEWRQSNDEAVTQLQATGVAKPWEKELLRRDGTRLAVTVASAMLDESRSITITSDLSGRKLAEEALSRSQEQLRQAQKMEAVGRLAGGVAHDFNNLLSIILSYSELSLMELGAADPMREDLEEVMKAGRRATELTRQLLLFSRQQVLAPKVLDLNELLTELDKMLRRIVGADVELVSLQSTDLGRVRVDPGSLEQVIMNLVVNARDAMPKGGKLTMETTNVYLAEDYPTNHFGAHSGPHVMLAVTDTGAGMDRETQSRIFEPFFTTKEVGKGTGLGLATVFGIVQASAGSVFVYSEVGLGTSFKIYFPRVDAEPESTVEAPVPTTLRGCETILLVEDEDQVRAVAANILRKYGYNVLEAAGPGQALLLSEQTEVTIDLLLSDVVMPQMSGPELSHRLTAARPEMKVLCMSGYTDDTIFLHGVMEARMAYLQKPFTPESLTLKVREVLDADT